MLDKLLLFIYSLAVGTIAVLAFCAGFKWLPKELLSDGVDELFRNEAIQVTVIIVSAIVFLISLRFFYVSLKRGGAASAMSIDQRTEFGDIRISIETVENLVLKAAGRQRGVKDLRTRIRLTDAGIDVTVRAVVDGESSIPAMTEEIQRSVKTHVEEITGIPVADVSVFVANIIQTSNVKSRVE